MKAPSIPKAFIWRRVHSLAGLWLVLYLIEHLLVNSQAALLFGENGRGFIHAVNSIHDLPYLPLIEVLVLGVPIAIHGLWGIQYLRTAAPNASATDGSKPALPEYPRNRAYTWQRITSWLLLIGIVAHVVQMRFIEYPTHAFVGDQPLFVVRLNADPGLPTVAERLGVRLLNQQDVKALEEKIPASPPAISSLPSLENQRERQEYAWREAITQRPLNETQVLAVAKDFGTAELLMVRDTFKQPLMMVIYTLFVLAACFHAFNGLWTCLITWGIILTEASQRILRKVSVGLMILVTFLGLAAIWGTYWINLKS